MIKINIRSGDPIHIQIEKQIVKLINLGVYEQDSLLPSVRSMACDLGINPNTVAKAYKSLEQAGIIYTVAGKGAFVSTRELDEIHKLVLKELEKAFVDAKNAGVEKSVVLNKVNQVWEEKE